MKRLRAKVFAFVIVVVSMATVLVYNYERRNKGQSTAKAASIKESVVKGLSSKKKQEFDKYAVTVDNIKVPQNTKIIGLGEASHGNVEFQELKLEVLKNLVKNNGVRAFVLEADFGGCSIVNDYVLGRGGKLEDVVRKLDFTIYQTKQMMDLVEWIKEYNSNVESNEKIHFYGCDIQNVMHNYGRIIDYYKIVNVNKVEELSQSAKGLFDNGYVDISLVDKYSLWIDNVKHDLEVNKELYRSKLDEMNYDYVMQYVECINMNIELTKIDNNSELDICVGLDYRDKSMVLVVENILNFEKKRGHSMIMLSAHNGHVARKDNKWKIMGQWLTEKYGKEYYVIGTDCYKTECNIQVTSKNERGIFKLCSKDPLAKLMKNNPNKYMYLEFGNILPKSYSYELINNNMSMLSLGEGFEKWHKYLPYVYRQKQVPTELYDGMIFVYQATPIEIID